MAKVKNKERWEITYESFKDGKYLEEIDNLNKQIEELKVEINGRTVTKEQYKEIVQKSGGLNNQLKEKEQQQANIEKNKDKIENVIQFKEQLIDETLVIAENLEKLENVQSTEEQKANLDKTMNELDQKIEKATSELENINNELNNPDLTPEERAKKETEKQSKLNEISENHSKYSKAFMDKKAIDEKPTISKAKIEEDKGKLKAELLKNEQLIGKCNLIGANLVKGKSIDDIQPQLSSFKFEPNKKFAEKLKAIREMRNAEKGKDVEIETKNVEPGEKEDTELSKEKEVHSSEENETALKEVTRFDKFMQNHPKIANAFNKLKNLFKKDKGEKTDVEPEGKSDLKEEIKEIKEETTKEESITEKDITSKNENSIEWAKRKMEKYGDDAVLTQIADKGINGFKESLKVAAKEKLAQNREEALKKEAERDEKHKNGKDDDGKEPGDE